MLWCRLAVLGVVLFLLPGPGRHAAVSQGAATITEQPQIVIQGVLGHFELVLGAESKIEILSPGSIDASNVSLITQDNAIRLEGNSEVRSMTCLGQDGLVTVSLDGGEAVPKSEFPVYRVVFPASASVEIHSGLAWVSGAMPHKLTGVLGGCSGGALEGHASEVSLSLEGSADLRIGSVDRLVIDANHGARLEVAHLVGSIEAHLSAASALVVERLDGHGLAQQAGGARLDVTGTGTASLNAQLSGAARLDVRGRLAALSVVATDAARILVEQADTVEEVTLQRAARARISGIAYDSRRNVWAE